MSGTDAGAGTNTLGNGEVGLICAVCIGNLGGAHHVGADFALAFMSIEIVAGCECGAAQASVR